jgi:pimeloyl-[acyl-carrier protein] methyl ester esterase
VDARCDGRPGRGDTDDLWPPFGEYLSAPVLVLLPGLEGTGNLFADFVSQLPPALPVIVGKYPTQKFLSYAELVSYVGGIVPGDTPFVLVAESFSTPLAVMFAATRPSNLVGLVLCAGFITNPAGNWTLLAKMLARRAVLRISPPHWFLEHFVMGKNPPPGLEVRFRESLRTVDATVLLERLRAVLSCDARDDLSRTEIPLMYIQAERDRLVPERCFREVQRVRPDVELVLIPDAPHLVLQREPRRCAEVIAQFIHGLRH